MFSGSSREIFFREINAWYPFIRFVGFGCFNGGTDSAFRWRHARFTRTWKREEQIGPLRTHYSLSKNPREFSFQNLPSDLQNYRTFREAGLCSVRSLLPWWVGRHGNCTSAWSSHHLVSFAAVIKVVTQRSVSWEETCVTTLITVDLLQVDLIITTAKATSRSETTYFVYFCSRAERRIWSSVRW